MTLWGRVKFEFWWRVAGYPMLRACQKYFDGQEES